MENNRTILIAEDEEINYFLIVEFLDDLNFNLIHANNGKEAVEICKSVPHIALILMDIKMPIMDGYTAALKIKKAHAELPIIAQSAFIFGSESQKYSGKAFDDYISKPIDVKILKQKVLKYIYKQ